jgi:hypothetical protein
MNEVDVCYLDDKGLFVKRKTVIYVGLDKAYQIFSDAINKLTSENQHALITIRKKEKGKWILLKAERI